jgi:50S ribosomal protein L16 3-hydroxylase
MLSEWLAPQTVEWFLENHLGKAPYACPGAAAGAVPLFEWQTLDGVLGGGGDTQPDVLVVRRGEMVAAPVPRSLADVRALVTAGVSVVVRGAERHDPGLAAIARGFERVLPGEVHVQLYATPGGSNSYGWHYDFEDVFIAQTAGVKDYYFRANSVSRDARLGDKLDFTAVSREVSPMFAARLLAGDWLYLPATWWHLVKCTDNALSISVGVMPPAALASASRLPPGWSGRVSSPER